MLRLGAGIALLWIAVGIALGTHYDYRIYLMQWARIMAGNDPWLADPSNAYGPGHVLLAPLIQIHPLLPKLLFLLGWPGIFAIVFVAANRDAVIGTFSFLVLFFTPFFFILIAVYGVGDSLVTFLTLLAVDRRIRKKQSVLPAFLLTLAGFTKVYPLVLLPFLATDRGVISFRFILATLAGCALAASLTYVVWGSSVLSIFQLATSRDSLMLSIFHFLWSSDLSPLAGSPVAHAFIVWNTAVLMVALGGLYALHFLMKMPALAGTVIAMIAMLAVYKVGNPQYFICASVLLIYFLAVEAHRDCLDRRLLLAAGGYLLVLNLFECWYIVFKGHSPASSFIGLPMFIVSVVLLWRLVQWARAATAPSAANGMAAAEVASVNRVAGLS